MGGTSGREFVSACGCKTLQHSRHIAIVPCVRAAAQVMMKNEAEAKALTAKRPFYVYEEKSLWDFELPQ
jgi:hypothetical protein